MTNILQEIASKWPEAFSQDEGINSSENTSADSETVEEVKEEEIKEEKEETKEEGENNEEDDLENNNEEDVQEEREEEKVKSKKKKSNVPKLLSERKELKWMVWELKSEIEQLKEWLSKVEDGKYYQTEKSSFVNKFPEAKEHLEEIEQTKQKFPDMSFEYAYRIVAPDKFVKGNTNPNSKWYTPDNLKEGKSYDKMSTNELRAEVQKSFEEWTFKLFS